MNAEAARQELVAAQRPCGPGDFSLEHDAAQRLLGGIVGRCQARIRRERPQRGPQLEDVGAGLGRAAALLLRATLRRRTHSALQPIKLLACELAAVAPTEHDQAQPEQLAPDLPGQALPLSDPIEVAQQVSPADLPALAVDERIAGIAVRRDHRGALLADEVQDSLLKTCASSRNASNRSAHHCISFARSVIHCALLYAPRTSSRSSCASCFSMTFRVPAGFIRTGREQGPKAMRSRHALVVQACERAVQRAVAERLAGIEGRRKHQRAVARQLAHLCQEGKGLLGQRYRVLRFHLHPRSWNSPGRGVFVELIPSSATQLTRSRRRHRQQCKRRLRHWIASIAGQLAKKRGGIALAQCRSVSCPGSVYSSPLVGIVSISLAHLWVAAVTALGLSMRAHSRLKYAPSADWLLPAWPRRAAGLCSASRAKPLPARSAQT